MKGRIQIIKKFITSKNINEIINKIENLNSIDLFSIDIDGIDYWIIDKIPDKISKILLRNSILFWSRLRNYRTRY